MENQRTKLQNNSLHRYCREVAAQLSEAGIDMKLLLEHFELEVTEHSIKEIFRQIGKQKFGKAHTSNFTTKEMQTAYEEVNRGTSLKGVSVAWPSEDEIYYQQNYGKTGNYK